QPVREANATPFTADESPTARVSNPPHRQWAITSSTPPVAAVDARTSFKTSLPEWISATAGRKSAATNPPMRINAKRAIGSAAPPNDRGTAMIPALVSEDCFAAIRWFALSQAASRRFLRPPILDRPLLFRSGRL